MVSPVLPAKPRKEVVRKPPILPRPVCNLMTGEVIQAVRNEHIFVDVKRRCNSLGKHVSDIVVGVSAVVQIGSKSSLPLLGLHDTLGVWRIPNEAPELQLLKP